MYSQPKSHNTLRTLVCLFAVALTLLSCSSPPSIPLAGGAHATNPTAETPWDRYLLLFMVDSDRPKELAAFVVVCNGMRLSNADGLTQTAVPIKGAGFTIENADIQLTVHIVDSAVITGTISARSEAALECGIPKSDDWRAICGVETGLTTLVLNGELIPADLLSPCAEAAAAPTPMK